MNRFSAHILSLALLVGALSACQPTQTAFPNISDAEIAAEQDYQRQYVAKEEWNKKRRKQERVLEQKMRLLKVSDKIAESAIELCGKIQRSIIDPEFCVYDFELTDQKGLNAWANGKKIGITYGMMKFASNDNDLATILGHEVAHNIMKHSSSRSNNANIGAIIGAVADSIAGSYGVNTHANISRMGATIGATAYSQDAEREADYVGLYISHRSGYKIGDAANLWRKLSLKKKKAIYGASSHPTNAERFIALNKTVEEIGYKLADGSAIIPTFTTPNLQASN